MSSRDTNIYRVHSMGSHDEQLISFLSAKGEVGNDIRDQDLTEKLSPGRITVNTVSCTAPDISVNINPESVGNPRIHFNKDRVPA